MSSEKEIQNFGSVCRRWARTTNINGGRTTAINEVLPWGTRNRREQWLKLVTLSCMSYGGHKVKDSMDVFYVVVMELEQRRLSYAQNKIRRVYGTPLPGVFLCLSFLDVVLEELRLLWWQSGCRQLVEARGKMNQTVSYFSHRKMRIHVSTNIHTVL